MSVPRCRGGEIVFLGGLAQSGEVSHNTVTWNCGQTTNRMTMIRMGAGAGTKTKGEKALTEAGQEEGKLYPGWKLFVQSRVG